MNTELAEMLIDDPKVSRKERKEYEEGKKWESSELSNLSLRLFLFASLCLRMKIFAEYDRELLRS